MSTCARITHPLRLQALDARLDTKLKQLGRRLVNARQSSCSSALCASGEVQQVVEELLRVLLSHGAELGVAFADDIFERVGQHNIRLVDVRPCCGVATNTGAFHQCSAHLGKLQTTIRRVSALE